MLLILIDLTSELVTQLCGSSRFRRRLRGDGPAGEPGVGGGIFCWDFSRFDVCSNSVRSKELTADCSA